MSRGITLLVSMLVSMIACSSIALARSKISTQPAEFFSNQEFQIICEGGEYDREFIEKNINTLLHYFKKARHYYGFDNIFFKIRVVSQSKFSEIKTWHPEFNDSAVVVSLDQEIYIPELTRDKNLNQIWGIQIKVLFNKRYGKKLSDKEMASEGRRISLTVSTEELKNKNKPLRIKINNNLQKLP